MKRTLLILLAIALCCTVFAGCQGSPASSAEPSSSADASPEPGSESTAAVKSVDSNLAGMTWDEIVAEANGQTVNFYMWGGSTTTNDFVDNVIGGKAKESGVTINRVAVGNITEALNIIMGEKQAGKDTGGECDLLWINGANFMTAKQGDLLFGPWAESIPSSAYVNWDDPAVKLDMGFEVAGYESPWGSAQLQMIYDSSRVNEEDLPKNFTQLMEWCKAHPGRFTYDAIPEFYGTRLLKSGIYELTGGFEQYQNINMTMEEFEKASADFWPWLQELNQYLWREGKSFPKSISDLDKLFSDNEVDFSMSLSGAGIAAQIESGAYPETAKVYAMDTSITDTNYVAIPYNSGSKAGAMVVANAIADPFVQAQAITMIGNKPAIDVSKCPADAQKRINDEWAKLPAGTYLTPEESARTAAPEVGAHLNPFIEQLWVKYIQTGQ